MIIQEIEKEQKDELIAEEDKHNNPEPDRDPKPARLFTLFDGAYNGWRQGKGQSDTQKEFKGKKEKTEETNHYDRACDNCGSTRRVRHVSACTLCWSCRSNRWNSTIGI